MQYLDPRQLHPMANQPRTYIDPEKLQSLAQTFETQGFKGSIIIWYPRPGYPEIISGHRSHRAFLLVAQKHSFAPPWDRIPCSVFRDITPGKAYELAILFNEKREDLTLLELALSWKRLVDDFAYTTKQIAKSFSTSHSTVCNTISVLNEPPYILAGAKSGKLKLADILQLKRMPEGLAKQKLAAKVIDGKLAKSRIAASVERFLHDGTGILAEQFIAPPFSVLDARQGYWTARKKKWTDLVLDDADARKEARVYGGGGQNYVSQELAHMGCSSIFDPVLAELLLYWFCPPKGKIIDPFAGGAAFGVVAGYKHYNFTGIELRQEQVDFNNQRCADLASTYICDDGQNIAAHVPPNSQDFLFSCPPYFDLEVYSDLPNDASNQKEYGDFLQIINNAFAGAISTLKNDRFAAIVISDVRDKAGAYRMLPDDIKHIFVENGMILYNDIVKIDPIGTLQMRAGQYMKWRKVGRSHQNVLIFFKGDTRHIKAEFEEIEYAK